AEALTFDEGNQDCQMNRGIEQTDECEAGELTPNGFCHGLSSVRRFRKWTHCRADGSAATSGRAAHPVSIQPVRLNKRGGGRPAFFPSVKSGNGRCPPCEWGTESYRGGSSRAVTAVTLSAPRCLVATQKSAGNLVLDVDVGIALRSPVLPAFIQRLLPETECPVLIFVHRKIDRRCSRRKLNWLCKSS